ncbi:hypothetical protein MRB53_017071 [Persea americana]|uniref:Uncharacterized protein n=1 Tax=Persea americana TaxID=3435 RepID=A0ACC2M3N6_PERAE|nr:hypothetical protein MRB53_017071 [Persea americana]
MGFWRAFFFIIVYLSLKYLTIEATRPWNGAVSTSRENRSGCSYTPGEDGDLDNAFSAVAVDVDGWDGSLTGSIITGV